MRKKTCIRRHQKTEPVSSEMARVIEHEERDERGEAVSEIQPELEGFQIPENYLPQEDSETLSQEQEKKV
jgi:hypothetical protein